MSRLRKCLEKEHVAKILVLIDETTECEKSVYYAGHTAAYRKINVVMVGCIDLHRDFRTWGRIEDQIKQEEMSKITDLTNYYANLLRTKFNIEPEIVVRDGAPGEQIVKLIDEDEDIVFLYLAAATESSGPGPVVSFCVQHSQTDLPIPLTIIPGVLTFEEIDAMI